jgi:7-cyano-7-deazaguanine synthase in queuosine biosynthesis
VSDASAWTAWASGLEPLLNFLSGDLWKLDFVEQHGPTEDIQLPPAPAVRVVLMSGGADSAVGAAKSRLDLPTAGRHTLVSHYSASHIAPIQRSLANQLETLVPDRDQSHEVFHIARRATRIDGTDYQSEPSSRSRSFLFLALGLAVASLHDVELWIPENGFASINPPLGPDRRGSLSTRTTHPAFIRGLNTFLASAGIPGQIRNPFEAMTKGEMFTWLATEVGDDAGSAYLSSTNSCSSTGQRSFGIPLKVHCGVCFGCVLRRAAFAASTVTDSTEYADSTANPGLADWLDRTTVVPAVRSFASRPLRARDLMALSLPHEYLLADALDLVRRGSAELAAYVQ